MHDPQHEPPRFQDPQRRYPATAWERRYTNEFGGEEDDVAEFILCPSWRVLHEGNEVGQLDWQPGKYRLTLYPPAGGVIDADRDGPQNPPQPPTTPKKTIRRWVEDQMKAAGFIRTLPVAGARIGRALRPLR